MLNKIIKFSLNNRLMVIVASVLLMIVGTYTASHMEVDVFPDLTAPTVVVLTEAHGMAPDEVEKLVSFPIETSVNGATNVRRVRSSSSAGISIVWVEFEASQANRAPSGWYLLGVNVLSTHRRRGIATLLTNWRIDWLAGRADQLFYVAIPTNVASIRLHEALGFVKARENVFMPPGLDGLTLFSRHVA